MNRRTQSTTVVVAKMISISFVLLTVPVLFAEHAMAQDSGNCGAIRDQVNDQLELLEDTAARVGTVGERIARGEAVDVNQQTLEKDKSTIGKIKTNIGKFLTKLTCCAKTTTDNAEAPSCSSIREKINDQVELLEDTAERVGKVSERIARGEAVDINRKTLEKDKSTIQKIKTNINKFLTQLADCCKKKTQQTSTPPTPGKPTPIFVRNYQPGEVFVGYMFLRAPGETAKNSNGFAVQMFYNFKPNLGIGGDLGCAWGSGRLGTTIDVSLQRCTYTFGPQISTKPNGKVQFFFHPLVGAVHDANKTTAGTLISKSSANALGLSIGGGINVHVNPRVEVRPIQVDYQPTHFGGFWQHNVRIATGIVFKFGKEKELPTW